MCITVEREKLRLNCYCCSTRKTEEFTHLAKDVLSSVKSCKYILNGCDNGLLLCALSEAHSQILVWEVKKSQEGILMELKIDVMKQAVLESIALLSVLPRQTWLAFTTGSTVSLLTAIGMNTTTYDINLLTQTPISELPKEFYIKDLLRLSLQSVLVHVSTGQLYVASFLGENCASISQNNPPIISLFLLEFPLQVLFASTMHPTQMSQDLVLACIADSHTIYFFDLSVDPFFWPSKKDVTITDSTNNGVTYQLWKGQRPLKCKRACLVEEAAKQLLLVPPGLGLVLSGDGCLRVHAGWK